MQKLSKAPSWLPSPPLNHAECLSKINQDIIIDCGLSPATPRLCALIDDIFDAYLAYEGCNALRRRKRTVHAQHQLRVVITCLVVNAVHAALRGAGGVALSRSHRRLYRRTRYDHPPLGKTTPRILDTLCGLGILTQQIGGDMTPQGRLLSTFSAGSKLFQMTVNSGVTVLDIKRLPAPETIILKAPKRSPRKGAKKIDYADTPETCCMRDEMAIINTTLEGARIEVVGDGESVDPRERSLRRVFTNGSFECGGRLFGGFWLDMKKDDRLRRIRLDGEAVVELDYRQMAPRIVYGWAVEAAQDPSLAPPADIDLYAIPGLEAHRDGVKLVMNAMLFATAPFKRMPQGAREKFGKLKITVGEVQKRILAAHPIIADYFFKGLGHQTQRVESDIMVRLLLKAAKMGVSILPVHDALIVPKGWETEFAIAMEKATMELVGLLVPVSVHSVNIAGAFREGLETELIKPSASPPVCGPSRP